MFFFLFCDDSNVFSFFAFPACPLTTSSSISQINYSISGSNSMNSSVYPPGAVHSLNYDAAVGMVTMTVLGVAINAVPCWEGALVYVSQRRARG